MNRSIPVLLLLSVMSASSWAACTVDSSNVSLTATGPNSETSVVYNPFNVQNSSVRLEITTTSTCDTALSGQFLAGDAASTEPAGYPRFVLSDGGTTVYDSDTANTYNAFSENSFPLAQTTFTYDFSAAPTGQANGETALGELSNTANIVLQLTADGVTQDITLPLSVSIPLVNEVALTDSFTAGDTGQDVAFGNLNGSEVSIDDKKLYLWSNSKYLVEVTSTNKGVMLRDGGATGDAALNKLPYELTLTKSGTDILVFNQSSPATGETTADQDPSTVDGDVIDIDVTIAAGASTTRRAGDYEDAVTLKITSRP